MSREQGIVTTLVYKCASCGGEVNVPHASAWPEQCPHCRTSPPWLMVPVPVGGVVPRV